MSLHKVFVYGTLKEREPNYNWITDKTKGSSKYLYKAETVKKYPLIIGTKYNIPFLLDCPGRGYNVLGEVYEVDDLMLKNLDKLEDHPNFYVREVDEVRPMNVETSSDPGTVNCWIYLIKAYRPQLLEQEYFKEYSSTGTHGLIYLERYLRDPSFNIIQEVRGSIIH